jgi:hypothetical protein
MVAAGRNGSHRSKRVIYPELVHQIIRDTPPKQADTLFAGSEFIYGFQNAQLLPRRCNPASEQ